MYVLIYDTNNSLESDRELPLSSRDRNLAKAFHFGEFFAVRDFFSWNFSGERGPKFLMTILCRNPGENAVANSVYLFW